MWFAYIDESKDPGRFCVYTALIMNADGWRNAFKKVKDFRKELRDQYGIYLLKELHAWKFAGGKGRPSNRILTKLQRAAHDGGTTRKTRKGWASLDKESARPTPTCCRLRLAFSNMA